MIKWKLIIHSADFIYYENSCYYRILFYVFFYIKSSYKYIQFYILPLYESNAHYYTYDVFLTNFIILFTVRSPNPQS